jgi:hypothetical protein
VVLQDDTDVSTGSPGLHGETYAASPQDGDQLMSVKVEEGSDTQDEAVAVAVPWRDVKTELEVSSVPKTRGIACRTSRRHPSPTAVPHVGARREYHGARRG